jgi:translation initiation factor 3 subunit B
MASIEEESASLDGYFSDTPLEPRPSYPPLLSTFERSIILTNLPKVPSSKHEKLSKVVLKLVSRIGNIATYEDEDSPTGFYLPIDEANDATVGCAFVEYETETDAKKALEVLQDYKFDKNHVLKVTLYERASSLANVTEEEFTMPEPEPYKERANTMAWLEDSCQRDQFAIRHGNDTGVYWCDGKGDPVLDYGGEREKKAGINWCDCKLMLF